MRSHYLVVSACLLGLIVLPATAQDAHRTDKFELFGGLSTLGTNPYSLPLEGWDASLTWRLNRKLGLVFQSDALFYGGLYSSTPCVEPGTAFGCNVQRRWVDFLMGPTVRMTSFRRVRPFAKLMIGGVHVSEDRLLGSSGGTLPFREQPDSDINFAVAIGAGLDVVLNERLTFRLIEADVVTRRKDSGNNPDSFDTRTVKPAFGLVVSF